MRGMGLVMWGWGYFYGDGGQVYGDGLDFYGIRFFHKFNCFVPVDYRSL